MTTVGVIEKPILFRGEMVRAILDGRKSMTRRVIKNCPNPTLGHYQEGGCCWEDWHVHQLESGEFAFTSTYAEDVIIGHCPYPVGSLAWVRETWCCKMEDGEFVYRNDGNHECWYEADGVHVIKDDGDGGVEYRKDGCEASPWKPSIFMPRALSRITLEITDVRVQRVQEITEEDAMAEGAEPRTNGVQDTIRGPEPTESYRTGFVYLWQSINQKRGFGWESNCWVWAITFRRIKP